MKFVFGPVPSRRLGQSLGIDPVPMKTCNWNCVYCQLGRSTPLINERRDYSPPEDVLSEVRDVLSGHKEGEIDWVTFAGSGEPLLHKSIDRLIAGVKAASDLPVALLTNGSLLHLPEVRKAVLPTDAVMPTIDAGSADMFRKINRPHPDVSFEQYIDGLVALREEYTGRFWPEVMLIKGLNDTEASLKDIADVLGRMNPDLVHINLPVRPPAETWIEPPDEEGMMRALVILGDTAHVVHPGGEGLELSGFDTAVDAIADVVSRHPMREDEIRDALDRWPAEQIEEALTQLESSGKIQVVERFGARFWTSASSRYPGEEQSRRSDRRTKHKHKKNE